MNYPYKRINEEVRNMKKKIIALCVIGLMVLGSAGFVAAAHGTEMKQVPLKDAFKHINHAKIPGVFLSFFKVKAHDNVQQKIGGYSLFYILVGKANHAVSWKLDYTVWFNSGEHRHGSQNGVGTTLSLGPVQISYGRMKNDWKDYGHGSYMGSLYLDGNETENDTDDGGQYDGEFAIDAGGDYSGNINEMIQFTGTVEGGVAPYSWQWYFGDGATSTEQNPQHAYAQNNTYEVLLTVTDATNQTADDNANAEIGINHGDDFHAYAGGEYVGNAGEPIQFYGFAEGGTTPYTWQWYFGDGATSTEQNPVHTYDANGSYEAMLTVTDANNETADDNAQVTIGSQQGEGFQCHAGDDYAAAVNEVIQFYGTASGGVEPYSWFWDFGDGATATEQNPTHAYAAAGEYTVALTVIDATGANATDETTADIGEDGGGQGDEFYVQADGPNEGAVGDTLQFYGIASGGVEPYAWFWDFGDGTTATEQNPTHVFTLQGEYDVMLTVTDAGNQTGDDTVHVQIGEQG